MNNITQVALVVKNLPANAAGTKRCRLDPWVWGKSPGIRNGDWLQYCCLAYSVDRAAWWTTVHGITEESDTTEQSIILLKLVLFKTLLMN